MRAKRTSVLPIQRVFMRYLGVGYSSVLIVRFHHPGCDDYECPEILHVHNQPLRSAGGQLLYPSLVNSSISANPGRSPASLGSNPQSEAAGGKTVLQPE